jgi:Na+/H+-dicarboxylate symporter
MADVTLALTLIVISFAIYFIPSIVASNRHKRNFGAIFALNFFAGWTFIGWLIALVWALTYEPKENENVAL